METAPTNDCQPSKIRLTLKSPCVNEKGETCVAKDPG
jgi:hypothetical protein